MRKFACTLIGMLAIGLDAYAQGAGQPSAPENLDSVLLGWEKAVAGLKRFVMVSERSTRDPILKTDEAPAKYIWTDKELYEFAASERKVCIYAVAQIKQVTVEMESPLTFLFGMSADQAKARYIMEYKGSDKYYHYIHVLPRQKQTDNVLVEARLSLFRANHLPAQIWYHQSGKETTWNFSKVQMDVQIGPSYIRQVIPQDWTIERIQPNGTANAPPTTRNKP